MENHKRGTLVVCEDGMQGRLYHQYPSGEWEATFGNGMPQNIGFEGSDFLIYDPENPIETRTDFDLAISKSVRGE